MMDAPNSSVAMLPTSTTTKTILNALLPLQASSIGRLNSNSAFGVHLLGKGFKTEQEGLASACIIKGAETIIDPAIIASSSNGNETTVVEVTSALPSSSKKSNNSTTKSSSASSLATVKLTTTTNSNNSAKSAITSGSGNNISNSAGKHYFRIPSDILDDLASRFIINVPDMELSNLIRICFQIELAHWFYLDFFSANEDKKLQACGIKHFAMQIFQHIPFLREHLSSIDKILEDWKNYKLTVPTYGAILISEDLNFCLLVQSYFAKCSWGFPKGKVNENEDPVHCATREVYEETGYDITELIVPNDYIEAVINYQYTRLYIVRNVSLQTQFSPRTRYEIKCCDWFPIDSLPINKNDAISKSKLGLNANSFFMIMPFVKRLKKWVNDKRSGIETRRKFSCGTSAGSAAAISGSTNTNPTPSSTSPVTATNIGGSNQKNSNSSFRKNNKQQSHKDDNNALKNGGASSSRSRRQRHKSMGDLDGVKLSNICNDSANSSNKNNSNKSNHNNDNNNGCGGAKVNANSANDCNPLPGNVNEVANSSHKRNAGKGSGASGGNGAANPSGQAKRQLFHSQSQNGTQNAEKTILCSDLIRKEKQPQLKCEKSCKEQKQQQQANGGNIRVRAMSQSDKMCAQQQQNTNKNSNNSSNNSNSKQRLQKQQSMVNTNSQSSNNNRVAGRFTPSSISGAGLAVVATTAAAVLPTNTPTNIYGENKPIAGILTTTGAAVHSPPKPTSVLSHVSVPSIISSSTPQEALLLDRMDSDTKIRILKRGDSQPNQDIEKLQLHHQSIKFTPSFNSWTNFSFTKNFIANVFC